METEADGASEKTKPIKANSNSLLVAREAYLVLGKGTEEYGKQKAIQRIPMSIGIEQGMVSFEVEMRDSVDSGGAERYGIAEFGLLVLDCAL